MSLTIAKAAPSLKFVIQDHSDVLKAGEVELPEEFKSRFEFMPFDFFSPLTFPVRPQQCRLLPTIGPPRSGRPQLHQDPPQHRSRAQGWLDGAGQ